MCVKSDLLLFNKFGLIQCVYFYKITASITWMTPFLAKTLAATTLTVVVGPFTSTPPSAVLISSISSPNKVATLPLLTCAAETVAPESDN